MWAVKVENKVYYDWDESKMLEVKLSHPDDFFKIKETLTRIGIESFASKNHLVQTCNILHKKGKYYIVHFKEMFALDGKKTTLTIDDIQRRNVIALLLNSWKLLTFVSDKPERVQIKIKVVPFKDKNDWTLISKYKIGEKYAN